MPATMPPARVVTVTTGTVHAVSADASRTVCARPADRMSPVPADAWSRSAVCVATCRTCDARTGGTMPPATAAPAPVPAPAPSPRVVTVDAGTDAYAITSADPSAVVVAPVTFADGRPDGTGDVIVTWHRCIVGARFHDADAAHRFASLPVAERDANRPASCPRPSAGYGACVRGVSHGGACADAHGHRFAFTPRPCVCHRYADGFGHTCADRRGEPVTPAPVPAPLPPAIASRADTLRAVARFTRHNRSAHVDTVPASASRWAGIVGGTYPPPPPGADASVPSRFHYPIPSRWASARVSARMMDGDTLRTDYRPPVPAR